jgi:hypothetical protein
MCKSIFGSGITLDYMNGSLKEKPVALPLHVKLSILRNVRQFVSTAGIYESLKLIPSKAIRHRGLAENWDTIQSRLKQLEDLLAVKEKKVPGKGKRKSD